MWNFDLLAADDPGRHPRPEEKVQTPDEVRALGPVMMQDLDLLPNIQKGLHQPSVDMLRLVPAEARIGRMHEILDRYLEPGADQRLPE